MNEFDITYDLFFEQQILQQSSIMSHLSECVALESGDIESLRAISESAVDKIKEVLHKIAEKIKEVFKKFTARVNQLVLTDQKYLEKYKDTILKNAFKDKQVTMYDYDINKLQTGFQIPNYNWNEIESICSAENVEAEFISTYFKELKADSNDSLSEQIQIAIRGEEEKEMSLLSLNRQDLYNFCINYKKNVEQINKDQEDVDKYINTLSSEIEKQYQSLSSQTSSNNNESRSQESAYSSVYGGIVTEVKIKDNNTNNKSDGNSNSAPGQSTMNTGAQQVKDIDNNTISKDINNNITNKVDLDNNNDNNKAASEKLEKIKGNITKFTQLLTSILTTKMNLLMAIYKDYMYILRDHVKEYAGEDGSGDNANGQSSQLQDKYGEFNYNGATAKITFLSNYSNASNSTTINGTEYLYLQKNNNAVQVIGGEVPEEISKVADNLASKSSADRNKTIVMSLNNCGDIHFIVTKNGKWVTANNVTVKKRDNNGVPIKIK